MPKKFSIKYKNKNKNKRNTKNKRKAGSRSREKTLAAKKIQAQIRGKLTRKNLNKMHERFSSTSRSTSKSKSPEICGICLENVGESERASMCCDSKHPYHGKCIDKLLASNHTNCPTCRQSLKFKIKLKVDSKTRDRLIINKILKQYSIQQLRHFETIIFGFSNELRGKIDAEFIKQCDYSLRFIRNMIDLHNRSEEITKLLEKLGFKKTSDYINMSYDTIIDTLETINEFMEAEEQEE